jgi:hypothetical protein
MLPKNWNDITIEQYVAVYKTLSEDPKDAEAQLNLLVKRVCLLTNQEPDWVEENCTMQDLAKMQDFLKSDLPLKLITDFRFEGRRYKVITNPNLLKRTIYKRILDTVKRNIGLDSKMDAVDATKMDFDGYMSSMNTIRDKDKALDNLHNTVFQICQEVDWKGRVIEIPEGEIIERIESFKQLPLKVANPIAVFFCSLSETLIQDTLTYSINQMKIATQKVQEEIDYLNA